MRRFGVPSVFLGALALGCGSDPAAPSAPKAPTPPICQSQSYADDSLPRVSVGEVTATLEDLTEGAIVDTPVTVCGIDLCSNLEHTDEEGVVVVHLADPVTKPAIKYGDGLRHAELALLLPPASEGLDLGTLYLPALPAEGSPITPGGVADSAGATLALAENATFTLEPFEPYDTAESRAFRAAELPPERFPEGLDHGAGLELVFTLAPLGAVLCPAGTLSLPNSSGWDAGTEVEFLVQGFGVGKEIGDQPFAPYGEWHSVATGRVDESGALLVMTEGGLPIISNVGVRRL